jgi:hypothetical protein
MENEPNVQPGANGANGGEVPGQAGPGQVNDPAANQAGKMLSQEQVNKIVSQRVNEIKSQYAGYEEATRKAAILDGMLKDPDFVSWLNGGGTTQGNQGGNANGQLNGGFDDVEDIPGLMKALPQIIAQTVTPMLRPFEQMAGTLQAATKATALNTELQRMSSTLDESGNLRYPGLHEPMFRGEVERIISEGRAYRLEDAYALAKSDRTMNGKGVPDSAFLLQSRMGGGFGQPQTNQGNKPDFSNAPKFKRPEDALSFVADKYGLK